MKILQLRFKNMNSLYGEWTIDFTDQQYLANGIFAITGPTGAGKSTILDAICLALYGATPRLGRVTKSENEIMSRQTGECFAEVVFESQQGRYRCHWSQHRARRRSDGNLAEARHEISDAVSGKLLEAKKRDTLQVIEEKTGMDFDRFTRSIMLAQGGFAAFLRADANERAPILEQITGTEIYSEISILVHERQRQENEKLRLLEAELSGVQLLSEQQLQTIEENIQKLSREETELTGEFNRLGQEQQFVSDILQLDQELAGIDDGYRRLFIDQDAFANDHKRLADALRAAEFAAGYSALSALREQQTEDLLSLQNCQKVQPLLRDKLQEAKRLFTQARTSYESLQQEQNGQQAIWQQVRILDSGLGQLNDTIKSSESKLTQIKAELSRLSTRLEQTEEVLTLSRQNQRHNRDWLDQNQQDGQLAAELGSLQTRLENLSESEGQLLSNQRQLAELKQEQEKLTARQAAASEQQRQTLEQQNLKASQQEKLQSRLEQLLDGRLLREFRQEEESLYREISFLDKIASLEAERNKLAAGKPCPLCGATEHPYASGFIPAGSDSEQRLQQVKSIIEDAEMLESSLRTVQSELGGIKAGLSALDAQQTGLLEQYKLLESQIRQQERQQNELAERRGHAYDQINQSLAKYRCQLPELRTTGEFGQEISQLLAKLRLRVQKWNEYEQKGRQLEQEIANTSAELEKTRTGMNIYLTQKQEAGAELTRLSQQYQQSLDQRLELFSDTDVDEAARQWSDRLKQASELVQNQREQAELAAKEFSNNQAVEQALADDIKRREPLLLQTERKFAELLSEAGFESETVWLAACLDFQERQNLQQQAEQLNNRQKQLGYRLLERRERLDKLITADLTSFAARLKTVYHRLIELTDIMRKSPGDFCYSSEWRITADGQFQQELVTGLSVLREQQGSCGQKLQQLRELIGAEKQKQSDHQQAYKKYLKSQQEIEEQQAEYRRWQALHSLIGSADGKKYRNFAQGITFDIMIALANRQLAQMTDRYLLIRDHNQPLELCVADNYQAGEIRSTRNLSGGESFIVSLALALGLAGMSSRRVRVDSLFLDEGFGTLDEASLETALDTLAGLHQAGKLIGVISHVGTMKERIATQLTIRPVSGGRSIISGPGVTGGKEVL